MLKSCNSSTQFPPALECRKATPLLRATVAHQGGGTSKSATVMIEWKPVIGYELRYEVSNTGSVRRIGGSVVGQWKSGQGYMLVRLSGPRTVASVHRLVAMAFIENPKCLPVINHLDFDPTNNNYSNLEWCTQKHNLNHSRKAGRMPSPWSKGMRSANARLPDDKVALIRQEYAGGGISWERIGFKYGVSKRSIGRIINMESYV